MIQFDKPSNLNGSQLMAELKAAGVSISEAPVLDGNGVLWLEISSADKVKASTIVESHNGTDEIKVLTIDEKLASVGLSINDLKTALGI